MAVMSTKRLLLVTFFLFCFISGTARARNLRTLQAERSTNGAEKVQNPTLVPKQGDHEGENLLTMDYTPARKKPPIHN
ncbi:hypothetical protein NMG60_11007161 [Bertholletia excelsa]